MIEPQHLLQLSATFYKAPKLIKDLLETFEDFDSLKAQLPSFLGKRRFSKEKVNLFLDRFNQYDAGQFKDDLEEKGISYITYFDEAYPLLLKEIYDPPMVLYTKGDISLLKTSSLAVVGPRAMSDYGKHVCHYFVSGLCPYLTIVSGGALGVDALAHQTALTKKGRTITVLGAGLDVLYPKQNSELFSKISIEGLCVSEFPPGVSPHPSNFPQRNRIISGISEGVLLVEASPKSGSLITARTAMEQGREVFAVPGSIFSGQSLGVHQLIQDGVKCTTTLSDILPSLAEEETPQLSLPQDSEAAGSDPFNKPVREFESQSEKLLYDALGAQPLTVDDLIEKSGLLITEVLQFLTVFELNDIVDKLSGDRYVVKATD